MNDDANGGGLRPCASGITANRKRLGLSGGDFRLMVGGRENTFYPWEQEKTKPRGKSLAAIAALRSIGKREVTRKLAELKQG